MRYNYYDPPKGEIVCPYNPSHRLSADKEPHSYYCYECAEHYVINPMDGPDAL